MATIARENIGLLNDKIIVRLSKDDYLPTFEKKVKEYSKSANIPGFRKGMVPAGMVKKMYGPSIYTDEILKAVNKELYGYLQTEKPDIFAQPISLETGFPKLDFNKPADYEFGFEIGLKPEFEIAPLGKAALTLYKVKVTDEMVQQEVERMLEKAARHTEREMTDDEANELKIRFTESDQEGNAAEGGIEKEVSVTLNDFSPALQKELMGKVKEDAVIIKLSESFSEDKLAIILEDLGLDKDDNAAAVKYFKLTILKIEQAEKRELNNEFFNEIFRDGTITTEEEFRDKIKEELQQYWNSQSNNQLQDQLYHYLLDETQMEFPASFLKRWLQTGGEKTKSAEEAEAEFPMFSNQLKWTLISDKIIKDNGLSVSMNELKASMKAEVARYLGGMGDDSLLDSYIDRMMKDEKQVESRYHTLSIARLFAWAQSQLTPAEKEVTPEELTGMMHHHHH